MHPLRILLDAAQSSQKSAELTATDGRNQVTTYFKAQVITFKTNKQKNLTKMDKSGGEYPFYLQ